MKLKFWVIILILDVLFYLVGSAFIMIKYKEKLEKFKIITDIKQIEVK